MENKSGAIYWFRCGALHVMRNTQERPRTFGERFKEHVKVPAAVHSHSNNTGHTTTQDNFQIIGKEDHGTDRTIKESI